MTKYNYPGEVWLNGQWVPSREARISVFDRGFLFGDGIYEVIPFYNGKSFGLQEHLDRLGYCLQQIKIAYDVSLLEPVIFEAVQRSGLAEADGAVYVQVTRGVAPRTHHFPEDCQPTLLLYSFPVSLEGFQDRHVNTMASSDFRWQRCDIKSVSLLPNVMQNTAAHERSFFENLLIRDGVFTEASHSTVFFVKGQTVWTHPEGEFILSGVTRKIVIQLCQQLGITVREAGVKIDDLEHVDEIFLTGTTTQILSVKSVVFREQTLFAAAEPGPVTQLLQQAFIRKTRSQEAL